nr:prolyl oligopeptidase family serine peptidase [Streptomyces agglomeratus]
MPGDPGPSDPTNDRSPTSRKVGQLLKTVAVLGRQDAARAGGGACGPGRDKSFHDASYCHLADRLAGKLLLVHGEMDDRFHPDHTLRLADRLIAAGKDFELLIVPRRRAHVHPPPGLRSHALLGLPGA